MVSTHAGAGLEQIEAVYRHRLAELRRVATAITGNPDAGRDAVQDAFAIAVHRRAQFRGEGSLEAWLWRIVVRSSRELVRRGATASASTLDESIVGSGELRRSGCGGEAALLLAQLPERQRLVIFLRYYADLDYTTIASAMEISRGTVGATLTQARDALRQLMTGVRS